MTVMFMFEDFLVVRYSGIVNRGKPGNRRPVVKYVYLVSVLYMYSVVRSNLLEFSLRLWGLSRVQRYILFRLIYKYFW